MNETSVGSDLKKKKNTEKRSVEVMTVIKTLDTKNTTQKVEKKAT